MPATMTITLSNLWFHAFHGLYPEEQKTGNEFTINLAATYIPDEETITEIGHTVNYAELYAIIKKEMQTPKALLETLAMEIAAKIREQYPQVTAVEISIQKLHPPIKGFTGNVGVIYKKDF
jgi:dihydroneopterin aldolase